MVNRKNLLLDLEGLLLRDEEPKLKPQCSYQPSSARLCLHFQKNPAEQFNKCKGCPVGFVLYHLTIFNKGEK